MMKAIFIICLCLLFISCQSSTQTGELERIDTYVDYWRITTLSGHTAGKLLKGRRLNISYADDKEALKIVEDRLSKLSPLPEWNADEFDHRGASIFRYSDGSTDTLGLGKGICLWQGMIYNNDSILLDILQIDWSYENMHPVFKSN